MENSNIFFELYNGNINWNESQLSKDAKYRNLLNQLCQLDDNLHSVSSKQASHLFDKYIKINQELTNMELSDAFRRGFLLARKLFKD